MKKALLYIVLLALPLPAFTQSVCPVTIDKVNPRVQQSWNRVGRALATNDAGRQHIVNTPDFSLQLDNNSGKGIRGLKVQATYFDATEDLYLIPIAWNANQQIKSGQQKTLRWGNELYKGDETDVGWVVVVQKVLFEDGSTWEYGSSTPSCFGEFWANKNHPRLTKLPEAERFQKGDQARSEAAPTR